jgi:hypothetical protein
MDDRTEAEVSVSSSCANMPTMPSWAHFVDAYGKNRTMANRGYVDGVLDNNTTKGTKKKKNKNKKREKDKEHE